MVVYSNITNFMSTEEITYGDRVVLHVLLSVVCKGYDVVLFMRQNDKYVSVCSQILAEYFFTKNINLKSIYISEEEIDISTIGEENIYFEVDDLDNEKDWKGYYSKLEDSNCQMYSYLYFGNKFDEKEEFVCTKIREQMKFMNGIFVANKQIEEAIYKTKSKCLAKIETLKLEAFAAEFKEDAFLNVDRGLAQIIKEGNYVVDLYDCDNPKTNRVRMSEVRKKYIDKKIIYVVLSQDDMDRYLKSLGKNRELGKNLFIIKSVDYYTLINLYTSALAVVVPKHCTSCEFEVVNIKRVNGKCLFL